MKQKNGFCSSRYCIKTNSTYAPKKHWFDLKGKFNAEGSELSEKIRQLKRKADDGKMLQIDVVYSEK
jgi:hypothetical protein